MRVPDIPIRGLGLGLDLEWGAATGFVREPAGHDRLAPRISSFLARSSGQFSQAFVSWQPKGRGTPKFADYAPTWDRMFAENPWPAVRGLHHTALNTGTTEVYERGPLLEFTNRLVERYQLRWVNEDLGIWSMNGRPVPYPLAPMLTEAGLAACVQNIVEVQRGLDVPFVVEFPGFTDGFALRVGHLDPYAYFCRVVEAADAPCCLDVGHLLGARWLLGHRGDALMQNLAQLPLHQCVELHMSGCSIVGNRFVDGHHGILLDEQLQLMQRLLPLCPNLRAITYEDPRFTPEGTLIAPSVAGFMALADAVTAWA